MTANHLQSSLRDFSNLRSWQRVTVSLDMNECVLNLSQDKVSAKSEFKLGFSKSPHRTALKRKRIEKIESDDDSSDRTSGPTVFEPDLHCSICVNMFQEPHVTRCGHTFCRQGSSYFNALVYSISFKY